MQLKKLLQGSAFALVAAACAIAVPSVVKAEETVEPEKGSMEAAELEDVYFQGSELYIEGIATEKNGSGVVTKQGTTEIQVGFGKIKNNTVTVSSPTVVDRVIQQAIAQELTLFLLKIPHTFYQQPVGLFKKLIAL